MSREAEHEELLKLIEDGSEAADAENALAIYGSIRRGLYDVDMRGARGTTALQCACVQGNTNAVIMLLQAGADPNKKSNEGWTPLHHTCWQLQPISIIVALVKWGGRINEVDERGWTPIMVALTIGAPADYIRLLVELGSDLEATDKEDRNVIKVAVEAGASNEIMDFLTE